jgi:hypothetical protein
MTTQQHDWNLILEEEGDSPLAPSCMQYLDTTLDMHATFRKFWDTLDAHYQKRGYADTRNRAYRVAGLCDSVSLNLIATHYGGLLSLGYIDNILVERNSVRDIRHLVLMRLTVPGSDASLLNAGTTIINSKFAELKKYPMSTDEGFSSQQALTTLLTGVFSTSNRMLRHKVLGGELPSGNAWFTDEALAVYTLENPEKVEDILSTIFERKTADVTVIRDVLTTDSHAMSAGVL